MLASTRTRTVADIRRRLGVMITEVRGDGLPTLISADNKPAAVLLSVEDFERRQGLLEQLSRELRPTSL